MKYFLLSLLFWFSAISQGQTTFKTMFYNILNYPTAPPQNRNTILKDILNTFEPDIFMVCELESEIAADDILNYSLGDINKNYLKANFVSNQSYVSTDSNLQQELFYNSDYFTLTNQEEILTNIRDINHYTLKLNTTNQASNPIYLEVFVTHLKASQGTTNEQKRLEMVTEFTNALNNLNPNSYVVFAGDFNFYTSSENGYQKILDLNNHVIMKDVMNLNNNLQSWHNNYNWKAIHTQATRLSNSDFNGYGASGGLDDRFDFITFSENIINNSEINYVQSSYKSYGNNGNCYNKRIDDNSCTGNFDFTLRSNLYLMSDHLPVVAELQSQNTLTLQEDFYNKNLVHLRNGNMIGDFISLKVDSKLLGQRLYVFNNIGQKIYSQRIKSENITIETSNLKSGFYFVKVEDYPKIIKFVKR
jgi:hypothetical protein